MNNNRNNNTNSTLYRLAVQLLHNGKEPAAVANGTTATPPSASIADANGTTATPPGAQHLLPRALMLKGVAAFAIATQVRCALCAQYASSLVHNMHLVLCTICV